MKLVSKKISEVCLVKGGGTPSTKREEYWNGDIPWLAPKELTNYSSRFITTTEKSITSLGLAKSSAQLMPVGSILLTSRATIGNLVINSVPMATNQGFINIVCNENIVRDYFYYWLKQNKETLISNAHGTTFLELIKSIFKNLEIIINENVLDQQKIASILSAYDDLIENNTSRIKILEEMAKTIYKEWFVNFRFPGYEKVKFVDSPLGKIPEGWEVVEVLDLVNRYIAGAKYTQKNVSEDGDIIVIDQSTDDYLGFHNNEPDHLASPTNPKIIFGDHTCKMKLLVRPFSVGPNVIPFDSKNSMPVHFLFYLINSLVETKEYKRHWNDLTSKKVVVPDQIKQNHFTDIVIPFFGKIESLKNKNNNLRKTRDLLLPKLISGEVKV